MGCHILVKIEHSPPSHVKDFRSRVLRAVAGRAGTETKAFNAASRVVDVQVKGSLNENSSTCNYDAWSKPMKFQQDCGALYPSPQYFVKSLKCVTQRV